VSVARVLDVTALVEAWAPLAWAEPWDNVGLLVGHPEAPVRRCLVALDCGPAELEEAARLPAELVIAHHPLPFRPMRAVRGDDPTGRLVSRAVAGGIAVYAAHTNLDVAPGGISDALGQALGLEEPAVLRETGRAAAYKLVVFVPPDAEERVRVAMGKAGAGRIGLYEGCAFAAPGTGVFTPLPGASPFVGEVGRTERVAEVRLEMLVDELHLEAAVAAMRAAHPYEEVAFDVVPLRGAGGVRGFGRVGRLAEPLPLRAFAARVRERLGATALRWCGDPSRLVRRVAVCGGAGGELAADAARAGADVLVTGDVKYHEAQHAVGLGVAVVDAGHFATEVPGVRALAQRLEAALAEAGWAVQVVTASSAADVWRGEAP
jgi:dinuclear metal center YbgI/SA1388 family protein